MPMARTRAASSARLPPPRCRVLAVEALAIEVLCSSSCLWRARRPSRNGCRREMPAGVAAAGRG
eukprot:CAMPEP_0204558002 /NCGR_PEP_ID=MMETSP0661-20131031/30773_1 /ASSEMBLY_ACC=CAM_ASM_000606 /TAXON_ID=109239 /ORGANISM="Alexandrium margalefi, Strain AMGDE01CS-322" /LENGTH=63 /DNA_ID=CAMNT_0051565151 /DNA_START=47 /DNA_END=234 /DNA_ORIENTATION=-